MRSVNVAKLKDRCSEYLKVAKRGEEVIIRERSLPVAKLVPFRAEDTSEEDLLLVAAGKMRLLQQSFDAKRLSRLPAAKVKGNKAVKALLATGKGGGETRGSVLRQQRSCTALRAGIFQSPCTTATEYTRRGVRDGGIGRCTSGFGRDAGYDEAYGLEAGVAAVDSFV
jgi:prevent-host-death family protein